MGMLGEFEYDTVFNDDYNPLPMAWIIYIAYLIVCCIIVMNLLVCVEKAFFINFFVFNFVQLLLVRTLPIFQNIYQEAYENKQ